MGEEFLRGRERGPAGKLHVVVHQHAELVRLRPPRRNSKSGYTSSHKTPGASEVGKALARAFGVLPPSPLPIHEEQYLSIPPPHLQTTLQFTKTLDETSSKNALRQTRAAR